MVHTSLAWYDVTIRYLTARVMSVVCGGRFVGCSCGFGAETADDGDHS